MSEGPPIDIAALATEPTPPSLHERAAMGEPDAYSMLAALHYQRGQEGKEPPAIAYARAADYARLAVCSRSERADWINLIYLLDEHASELRALGLTTSADEAQAEAIALTECMAEEGDEEMGDLVVRSADALTPEAFRIAHELRAHVGRIFNPETNKDEH